MLKVKKKFIYLIIFVLLISSSIFFSKDKILIQIGHFLLFSEEPEKADIIVIIRGGLFVRTIEAVELYKQGYGDRILIQMALIDDVANQLRKFGVTLPTRQDQVRSILEQLGIPAESIILSTYNPGGGTVGEAYRVKKDILRLKIKRFIIVTTWYHTKRVYNIYKKVFSDMDVKFWVVASKYGKSNPKNWWHFRYKSRAVLTEFPKTLLSYIDPTFNFSFEDDPVRN